MRIVALEKFEQVTFIDMLNQANRVANNKALNIAAPVLEQV